MNKQIGKGQWLVQFIAMIVACILIFLLSSCSSYYYQNKGPKVTHVLALTEEGDTLKIPIKDIKPNVIYNVVGYDWWYPRPSYYSRWDNPYYLRPHFYNTPKPSNNGNSSYNNNGSNNTPVNTPPTIKPGGSGITPPPTPVNPRKRN